MEVKQEGDPPVFYCGCDGFVVVCECVSRLRALPRKMYPKWLYVSGEMISNVHILIYIFSKHILLYHLNLKMVFKGICNHGILGWREL